MNISSGTEATSGITLGEVHEEMDEWKRGNSSNNNNNNSHDRSTSRVALRLLQLAGLLQNYQAAGKLEFSSTCFN